MGLDGLLNLKSLVNLTSLVGQMGLVGLMGLVRVEFSYHIEAFDLDKYKENTLNYIKLEIYILGVKFETWDHSLILI